jgi:multidrug efflux system membrane fusion protein
MFDKGPHPTAPSEDQPMSLLVPARRPLGVLFLGFLLAATAFGCRRPQAQAPAPEKPVVPVSHPVRREVTDYVYYTGRTAAVEAVSIRARVTGYLTKIPFKEGSEVKKDDLLFEIDPRPYKALVDQADAQVTLSKAQYNLAKATYERDMAANARTPGTVAQQQIDQDRASVEEADARIKAAQASLEAYRLNLGFTEVRSPIDGQVGRVYYTLGNLVTQDSTLLTTVVSLDPMYAYFDVDERTVLRVRNAINAGKIAPAPDLSAIPVGLGLEGEDGFPHPGKLDFVNNTVNPNTGTMSVRGRFDNPRPENGRRLLSPGMFVRVRLPIGSAYTATLVIDRAIGSDQGLKFVYVVDKDNKIVYRRVTTGALQEDGLRVVEGVSADEWVVVGALQQVRPKMEVETEEVPMPTVVNAAGEAPAGPSGRPQPPPPGENKQQKQPNGQNKR